MKVATITFLLFTTTILASDPKIDLPAIQVLKPEPTPKPTFLPQVLVADSMYVIDSEIECFIYTYPKTLINITTEKGPISIKGKFIETPTVSKRREFHGPFVYVLEPIGEGHVYFNVIPKGVTDPTKIFERDLDVLKGLVPVPPLPPTPNPVDPLIPPPVSDLGLRVLFVFENTDLRKLPPEQVAIATSTKLRDYLDKRCVLESKTRAYRFYDKDTKLTNDYPVWGKLMGVPRQSVPWIVICNGKTWTSIPMPGNVDDAIKLIDGF